MKKLYTFIICVFFFASLPAQNAGDLDLSYGTDGISAQGFLFPNGISDISILTDNTIVSGGYYHSTGDNLLSFRFNTDGSLAPFNTATWFEHYFDDYENITATFALPDNKTILAGWYGLVDKSYFVIQLTPDGFPDPTFGTDGVLTGDVDFIAQGIDVFYGLSGDYSIYLAGNKDGYTTPAILKLYEDGTVATTFGTDGFYEYPGYDGGFSDIYVHSFAGSGYIFVCGNKDLDNMSSVSKHNLGTGELITDFATDGVFNFMVPDGSNTWASSLVYTSSITNSKIAVVGDYVHADGDSDVYAYRLDVTTGNPDPGFGVNGHSEIRLATSSEYVFDALAQAGGKYYIGGSSNMSGTSDFFLGRLNSDGTLDLTFGVNGVVTTDIQGADYIAGLALNDDQTRIYAGGISSNENSNRAGTMACYYTDFGVAVDDNSALTTNQLKTYPNPASDHIIVVAEQEGLYEVELYNVNGMLVTQTHLSGKKLRLDINEFEKGVYLLKVFNQKTFMNRKVAIQ